MEISNLLDKIKGGEKEQPVSFLALEVTDELVQAAVWQVIGGHTEVLAIGIPVEWDGEKGDAKELVSATDATIANAVEGINQELNQVIFGLNATWIDNESIIASKRQLLKAICHDLELKPLGFVVVTDSLLRYLKMQEGTPTTAILVQVTSDTLSVMLLRFGKTESSVILGRSDDIVADLEESLSRFPNAGVFPSRIIVYDCMHNLDDLVQNLLSYDWQNKFKFLHVPKIESLPKDILIRSIAIAGGSEVAKSIGFSIEEIPAAGEESILQEKLVPAEDLGFSPSQKPSPSPSPQAQTLRPTEKPPSPSSQPKPKRSLKLPRLVLPKLSLSNQPPLVLFLGSLALILIILGFTFIWLIPKAKVVITVEPKILDENTSLTLSSLATTLDLEKSIVPAKLITKIVKGENTAPTTGTKTIGDKSTGDVTIYNRTSLPKTFPAGTILTSNSLKFTLLEDVTVASSSSTEDSEFKKIITPGKADTKITAGTIGEESNLPESTEFKIGNFSTDTYLAKNSSALAGGSSKEIRVVSQNDQDNLLASLSAKLTDQALQEITQEIGEGKGIYLFEKGTKIINQSSSAKVDDEASALTLNLELETKGFSYEFNNVEQLVASTLTRSIPSDYERTSDPPQVELGDVLIQGSDEVEAKAKITVYLLPAFDKSTVQNALKGHAASEVEAILSNFVGLVSAEAEITPLWLSSQFKRMPRNPSNISVIIQASK